MDFLHPDGRDGRLVFFAKSFTIGLVFNWILLWLLQPFIDDFLAFAIASSVEANTTGVITAEPPGISPTRIVGTIGVAFASFAVTILLNIRRLNDLGHRKLTVLWMFVPIFNIAFCLYLLFAPGQLKYEQKVDYRERFLPAPDTTVAPTTAFSGFDVWQPTPEPGLQAWSPPETK